jgi:hypothetical protein
MRLGSEDRRRRSVNFIKNEGRALRREIGGGFCSGGAQSSLGTLL